MLVPLQLGLIKTICHAIFDIGSTKTFIQVTNNDISYIHFIYDVFKMPIMCEIETVSKEDRSVFFIVC